LSYPSCHIGKYKNREDVDFHTLLLVGLEPTIPVFETQAQWALYAVNNDRGYFEIFTSMSVQIVVFRFFILKMQAVCCSCEMSVWGYKVAFCHRSEVQGLKMFTEKHIQANGFSRPL
jgi:hypothetical protein